MYYLKGAAAGGICCSITHGALTPVDVVKTRVQLDPVKVSTDSTNRKNRTRTKERCRGYSDNHHRHCDDDDDDDDDILCQSSQRQITITRQCALQDLLWIERSTPCRVLVIRRHRVGRHCRPQCRFVVIIVVFTLFDAPALPTAFARHFTHLSHCTHTTLPCPALPYSNPTPFHNDHDHDKQYNKGLVGGFRQIIAEEGAMALTTGLGATAFGYFIQGWFKFGGVELIKINLAQSLGEEKAWDNKTAIYLGAAAGAEFVADIFLCPLEAVRIRSVSDPTFATGLADGFVKMAKSEGLIGFYAGLAPILAKQIPYTMAKFAVQGSAADALYGSMGKTPD